MGFLNNLIKPSNPAMTQEQIINKHIQDFESSQKRNNMLVGEKYYDNENDIKQRKMYKYIDGQKVEDKERPNNKLSHGFANLLVDEKVSYLLGTSPKVTADDEEFQKKIIDILDYKFGDKLQEIGVEASNKGIAWLQPYINNTGELKFRKHESEQIIPIYKDSTKEEIEAIIRFYYVETYEGDKKTDVKKVEYWTKDTVTYYTDYKGSLIPDIEAPGKGEPIGHFLVNGKYQSWSKVPFIPFRNNSREKNDLTFFKDLIDDYDKNTSDTSNTLDDIARFIYVLKNYGGTDLDEFLNDLKLYKVVKVDDEGGVDKLSPDIDVEAVEQHLNRLKKDIYTFGKGVDKDTDKFGNSPSGIALKFLYSALDLKCDQMERKFKNAFDELFWFIAEYLKVTNKGAYDYKTAKVTFVRNMLINTSDAIKNVSDSQGIISKKTQLENHPFVSDVAEEEERLKEEENINLPFQDKIPTEDGGVNEE
ncbi:phage portal protein [Clostridium sporogenes]|uniref:phage portal protein n=1 Tax=Clostridium sporogenes TaxID=1509 RepID=UPI0022370D59|nr:phage portal protein [Clostridium sporogenes]MCW6112192.1 phage portal protein [Clostridium sporogenes]